MEPVRWSRLNDLVADALERPESERDAYLAHACPDDDALREEAASLLVAYAAAERSDALHSPLAAPTHVMPERVGPWRPTRRLGEGGMGVVYAAERADGAFHRTAALKLVRPGFRSDFEARFRRERQLLARLDDPGVARLLDGGVTEEGRPYLAMELVEGTPITLYVARHGLSVEARVRLFLQACDAVAYAHRNTVVHRDLKPDHILVVEAEPGAPRVKLLDFGIAKLLDDPDHDEPFTQTALGLMTPQYAAPEQFRAAPVTTATDVYSLGVVLYELLAGQRPYGLVGLSPGEAERIVCEQEPPRPSTVVTRAPTSGAHTAATARIERKLRGDLDQIILKALRKEPERRYASADALGDDLRRYLSGQPVAARPDTVGYRAARFVRRHRVGVGAAVLLLLSLAGGLVATGVQARRARAEAAKAEGINRFLLGMLAAPAPDVSGRDITVASLLDSAAAQVGGELQEQPEVEAAVRHTLGTSYHALGLYEEAEAQLRQALTLRERWHGPHHTDVAETKSALALTLQRRGSFDEAETLFRAALATDEALLGEEHTRVARHLNDLGVLLWDQGRYEDAEPLLRRSLEMDERLRGPEHEAVATSLGNLATLLADQGKDAEAEGLYRRALALLQARYGRDDVRTAQALSHLGVVRHDLGDLAEAESLHTAALDLYRRHKGDAHADVAYAYNNLATVKADLGQVEEAERLQRAALATVRAALGPTHPNVGIQLNNLGFTRRQQGDIAGAEGFYREAVAVWREGLSPDHPYLAYGLHNLGTVLSAQGRPAEAEAPLREALEIRRRALPPGHDHTATTASILGEVLGEIGRREEGLPLLEEAVATLTATLGPEHARTVEARERIGRFQAAQ